MNSLQKTLIKQIENFGYECKVNNKNTNEMINAYFTVNEDDYDYELSDLEQVYVTNKLALYNQQFIKNVINRLKKDIHSRQAIITFDVNSNNPNCEVSLQFLIRYNKLYTIVYSRSLDVKNKLYTDIEIAREFSTIIENVFKIKLSYIQFYVGSMHTYV